MARNSRLYGHGSTRLNPDLARARFPRSLTPEWQEHRSETTLFHGQNSNCLKFRRNITLPQQGHNITGPALQERILFHPSFKGRGSGIKVPGMFFGPVPASLRTLACTALLLQCICNAPSRPMVLHIVLGSKRHNRPSACHWPIR